MRRSIAPLLALLAALAASPLLLRADTPADGHFPWRETEEFQVRRREKEAKVVRGTDGRDWTTVHAKSYAVATELDPRFTAEISEFLDVFRDHVQQIFTSPIRVDRRPRVFVYGSHEAYQAKVQNGSRAMFKCHYDGRGKFDLLSIYAFVNKEKELPFGHYPYQDLQHEATHEIIQEHVGARPVPSWFTEGLAMYFELWDVRKTQDENLRTRPSHSRHCVRLAQYLEQGLVPDLGSLLRCTTYKTWVPDDFGPRTHAHYAAAEALFMFLMKESSTRKYVVKFYEEILAGRDPVAVFAPEALKKLDAEWQDFMRTKMPPVKRPAPSPPPPGETPAPAPSPPMSDPPEPEGEGKLTPPPPDGGQ